MEHPPPEDIYSVIQLALAHARASPTTTTARLATSSLNDPTVKDSQAEILMGGQETNEHAQTGPLGQQGELYDQCVRLIIDAKIL
jgi:hypothetical protein